MKFFKGIIHLHSNYSYDGQHTLKEIVDFGKKEGYHFLAMSEHSDTLNEGKFYEYIECCDQISSSDLVLIPGIEFTCDDGLHLLGLGVRKYFTSRDHLEVAQFIKDEQGAAIIAHPIRYHCKISHEVLNSVDGVEIWNVVYDGRFVPNPAVLKWFRRVHENGINILGYGGQDLHRITEKSKLETIIYSETLSEERVISALKKGNFIISNTWFKIDPWANLSIFKRSQIKLERFAYEFLRSIKNKLSAISFILFVLIF